MDQVELELTAYLPMEYSSPRWWYLRAITTQGVGCSSKAVLAVWVDLEGGGGDL